MLIFVSYVIITINLVVTLVERYLVVSAGYIFLGFGGSRWTAPYTERYIGLAVSIGIKLLFLYCVIAAGQSLGAGWNAEASGIGTSTTPAKAALDVIGGALIYMMCCWQIPKIFCAVIGGSPALTVGDLVMAGTAVAGGALAAASIGAGAIAGVAGAGAGAAGSVSAGSAAVGTSSAANAAGSSGSSVASAILSVGSASAASGSSSAAPSTAARPPFAPPMSSGSGSGVQSSMNGVGKASGLDEVGGQPLAGSGCESEQSSRGFSQSSNSSRSLPPPGSKPGVAPPADKVNSANTDTPGTNQSRSGQSNSIARGATKASNRLRSASDAARRIRLNDSHAPGSPPRMPIDHQE